MSPRPPRVSLDHVLVAVPDLAEGQRRFATEYGLRALEGGRHPGAAAVAHPSGARTIGAVRLGDPSPQQAAARIRALLGDDLPFAVENAGTAGVLAVELDTPGGPLVIR